MNDYAGTILVVDDEPNNIEMLSRRLQRHHYAVDSARSGVEALERLTTRAYDATLLDVMMPGLDGLGVLRQLRSQPINAATPVIMVTAKSGSEDVAEAFDHGADDFIAKPIDFRVLLARLKSQIARHQAQLRLESRNRELTDTLDRMSRMVSAVSGCACREERVQEPCDINRLIEDAAALTRHAWSTVATLTLTLDPLMPKVTCFPVGLGRAILALIVDAANVAREAREAGRGLGTITIHSRFHAEDRQVEIRIADDAMPRPHQAVRPALAAARGVIAELHNGSLTLDESVARGADVVISIPV